MGHTSVKHYGNPGRSDVYMCNMITLSYMIVYRLGLLPRKRERYWAKRLP